MELHHYLEPARKSWRKVAGISDDEALGTMVDFFDGAADWFRNHKPDIVILGVPEARGGQHRSSASAPGEVRHWLYGLRGITGQPPIADLGDVKGATLNDRYQALADVMEQLAKAQVLVVLIGGSQDLTVSMSHYLKDRRTGQDIAIADAKLDLDSEEEDFNDEAFIQRVSEKLGNSLDKVSVMGVQQYYLSPRREQYMQKHYYQWLRLRDLKGDQIEKSEPVLRDASLLSFDFGSLEVPVGSNPFGFSGTEACRLFWYAGASDRMGVIGLFNLPVGQEHHHSVSVGALMIWHALEGTAARCGDYPYRSLEEYEYKAVFLDDYDENIRFYHNPENDRWWLEVPWYEGTRVVSCHASVYEEALRKEIPEIWWMYYLKTKDNQGTGRII